MNYLPSWLSLDVVQDIGWTLVHFLWQGLALALLLQLILPMCRRPTIRHNLALGTLVLMAVAPVATFVFLYQHGTISNAVLPSGAISRSALESADSTTDFFVYTSASSPWIDWLVVLWFTGVALLSLRAIGGWYLAEQLRRRDTLALPAETLQRCHALQRRLMLTWPILFLQSRRVKVPIVVGWFRPVILIPVSAITGLPPQQLDALIMHELAHIRRLDAFTNIVLVAVETILFYHPAVWWVSRRVRIEREHCCDDFAVAICDDAMSYVEALTSLETWKVISVPVLAASGGKLKERVAYLLGVRSHPRRPLLSAIACLAFICLIVAAVITAQSSTQARETHFDIHVVDDSFTEDVQKKLTGDSGNTGTVIAQNEIRPSESVLRAYIAALERGDPGDDLWHYSSPVVGYTPDHIQREDTTHRAWITRMGSLLSLTYKETSPDGFDIYDAQFANYVGTISVLLTPDGKIRSFSSNGSTPGVPLFNIRRNLQ